MLYWMCCCILYAALVKGHLLLFFSRSNLHLNSYLFSIYHVLCSQQEISENTESNSVESERIIGWGGIVGEVCLTTNTPYFHTVVARGMIRKLKLLLSDFFLLRSSLLSSRLSVFMSSFVKITFISSLFITFSFPYAHFMHFMFFFIINNPTQSQRCCLPWANVF